VPPEGSAGRLLGSVFESISGRPAKKLTVIVAAMLPDVINGLVVMRGLIDVAERKRAWWRYHTPFIHPAYPAYHVPGANFYMRSAIP
jgi:hypothetical protein